MREWLQQSGFTADEVCRLTHDDNIDSILRLIHKKKRNDPLTRSESSDCKSFGIQPARLKALYSESSTAVGGAWCCDAFIVHGARVV